MSRLNLLQKALLALTAILLPIFILFFLDYNRDREYSKRHSLHDLKLLASAYEGLTHHFLEMSRRRAKDFSSDGFIWAGLKETIKGNKKDKGIELIRKHLINVKMPLDDTIFQISVISLKGKIIASTNENATGMNVSNRPFFINAKNGVYIVEDGEPAGGQKRLAVSSPINDRETGELIGILTNSIRLSELNKVLSGQYSRGFGEEPDEINKEEDFHFYIVNSDRYVIAQSNMEANNSPFTSIVHSDPVEACLKSDKSIAGLYKNHKGLTVVGASSCIPSMGWILLAEVDADHVFLDLIKMRRDFFITSVLIFVLTTIIFLMFYKTIIVPIKKAAIASNKVAMGNYDVNIPIFGRDEVGSLAESFNTMVRELKSSNAAFRESEMRLIEAQKIANIGNWEWDVASGKIHLYYELYRILGVAPNEFNKTLDAFIAYVHPLDKENVERAFEQATTLKKPMSIDHRIIKSDGAELFIHEEGRVECNEEGDVIRVIGTAQDITERTNTESQLIRVSTHDALTGLINRRHFVEILNEWIHFAKLKSDTAALLLVNIDDFQIINDTYGHKTGDELLRHMSNMLTNTINEMKYDITLARLGSDEFALFIPLVNENEEMEIAEKVRERCEASHFTGLKLGTSVSVAAVLYPEQGGTVKELLIKGDAALARAKILGKNRCHLYSPEDKQFEDTHERLVWKGRIQKALEESRFNPWFQPILELKTGKVSHYEALARLSDEDGNVVLPWAFIDVAEGFKLIGGIDRAIAEKTMRLQAKMTAQKRYLSFGMNLSGKDLGDDDLLLFLQEKITETGADPNHLIFEITETAAIHELEGAIKFINALKDMGCHFALDDFGVGFTSFLYLKEMRVDYIKIDGSFIKDLNNNHDDQIIVKSITEVARGMGIKTIAEFVENEEVLNLLKEIGVDYAQGYHIGKPAPELLDN